MTAPHRSVQLNVTIAASAVVAAVLIYAGITRGRSAEAAHAPKAVPTAAAPAKESFAKIGIGACDDKVEVAAPAAPAPVEGSCDLPVAHDTDLASLGVDETSTFRR